VVSVFAASEMAAPTVTWLDSGIRLETPAGVFRFARSTLPKPG
jgi:hypothetical protein